MAVELEKMIENVELTRSDCTAVGSTAACYCVSVLSGSLEVSARLKNADDLELLIKVLEANKTLFAKADRSATEDVVKATETSAKADRLETKACAKADQSEAP
jgi:hypothetical protein